MFQPFQLSRRSLQVGQGGCIVGTQHGGRGYKELSCGQRVPKRMVPAVLGQAEVLGRGSEPDMPGDEGSTVSGDEESAEYVGVDEVAWFQVADRQPAVEEAAFHLGDVCNHHAATNSELHLVRDVGGRMTGGCVHGADAMEHHTPSARCDRGPNCLVVLLPDLDASVIDGQDSDRQNLVYPLVCPRRLEIDHCVGHVAPMCHQ